MNMAPQFWRFTPALALLTAPLFVALAFLFSDALATAPGFDWNQFRYAAIGGLIVAGIAFYQAPRIDRITAAAVIAAAFSVGWCFFVVSGRYGAGVGFIELGILGLWLFALVAIFGTAYAHLRWLRWIALPVVLLAALGCLLWFGHEVIFVYAPMVVSALTAPT